MGSEKDVVIRNNQIKGLRKWAKFLSSKRYQVSSMGGKRMNVTDPSSAARAPLREGGQVRLLHKALPPLLKVLGGHQADGVALLVPRLPPARVGGVDHLHTDVTLQTLHGSLSRETGDCFTCRISPYLKGRPISVQGRRVSLWGS